MIPRKPIPRSSALATPLSRMTMLPRKCIATSASVIVAAFGIAAAAYAAPPAGTLTRANGLVFAQAADGHSKILAEGSTIGAGDRLVSGNAGYARVELSGRGYVILGPATEVSIDGGEATLVRGAMQVSGGTIVKTALGTISGADSIYVVTYSPVDAAKVAVASPVMLAELSPELQGIYSDAPHVQITQAPPPTAGAGSPGLYVQVLDGVIHLTNGAGTQNFTAGQFGFTPSFRTPPVILPQNPGLQFAPPPNFATTNQSSSSTSKSGPVDCEVR
jgi:hypothetical protein